MSFWLPLITKLDMRLSTVIPHSAGLAFQKAPESIGQFGLCPMSSFKIVFAAYVRNGKMWYHCDFLKTRNWLVFERNLRWKATQFVDEKELLCLLCVFFRQRLYFRTDCWICKKCNIHESVIQLQKVYSEISSLELTLGERDLKVTAIKWSYGYWNFMKV